MLIGSEGLAHDYRIFLDAIGNPSLNFPKLPLGNFLHFNLNNQGILIMLVFIFMLKQILLSRQRIS